jgi:hypothetical protein
MAVKLFPQFFYRVQIGGGGNYARFGGSTPSGFGDRSKYYRSPYTATIVTYLLNVLGWSAICNEVSSSFRPPSNWNIREEAPVSSITRTYGYTWNAYAPYRLRGQLRLLLHFIEALWRIPFHTTETRRVYCEADWAVYTNPKRARELAEKLPPKKKAEILAQLERFSG